MKFVRCGGYRDRGRTGETKRLVSDDRPQYAKKPPGFSRGLLIQWQEPSLTADLNCASATATPDNAGTTGGDHLHPQRILGLVVRGGIGLAQRRQAALLSARSRRD